MTTQQLVAFLFLLAPLAVAAVAALTLLKPWARTEQAVDTENNNIVGDMAMSRLRFERSNERSTPSAK